MSHRERFILRGRWPNGATTEHGGASVAELRTLAKNWSEAGAEAIISRGGYLVERYHPLEARKATL